MSSVIRPCDPADLSAVTTIYAHWVRYGTGTFEEIPPTVEEMTVRRQRALAEGLPFLVVEVDGAVVGYAYAAVYRGRSAYRFTVEDSIYLHPDHLHAGLGRALLAALIEECERVGCRQMVALIGDSANEPSIRLHERFGFRPAGVLRSVGYKFGLWLDTVRLQRQLGPGDAAPPQERGGP
jgi:L-amino acid N-acyltransferase YncA